MKHNYSNADIRRATVFSDLDVHAADVRLILNALPEPAADDWQECRFEDIRTGDRVKRVRIYGSGTTDIREGVVANKDAHFASCTQKRILVSAEDLNSLIVKLYRIPAPIVHPDPLEHPVIINLHTTDDEVFDYAVWDAEDFYLCYTHEGEFMRVAEPSEITKFTPAKVVEDDR